MTKILALDLAIRTGWATGFVDDDRPLTGSVQCARDGASLGAVLSGIRAWLWAFLVVNSDIKLVVFETPMTPAHMQGGTNITTIRSLIGMASVAEEALYTIGGLDVREATV